MTQEAMGPPAPAALKSIVLRPWMPPAGLFVILLAVYTLDGRFLPTRDAVPNVCLPVEILKRGSMSFSPKEAPFMFIWTLQGLPPRKIDVDAWDQEIQGRRAGDLLAEGHLTDPKPRYYLTPSILEDRYVGIYGPGAGLSAVPYFAVLSLVTGNWSQNMAVLGQESKVFSSVCVAGAGVLVMLTFLRFVSGSTPFFAGLLFGLGTCVWAEPTQALWQQTPVILLVALTAYLLTRMGGRPLLSGIPGLCCGAAVLCRPTLLLLLAACLGYLLWKCRREALPFTLGALPPLLFLAGYNMHFLGSPFRMGQTAAARQLALSITGSDNIWQTPVWEGAAGILLSPSRGLLVFSPFLVFTGWGIVEIWRHPSLELFRAWTVAVAGLLLVASVWIEWFGGWVYGYRLIVELTPLFMLFLIPVAERIRTSRVLLGIFLLLSAISIGIQALGAFDYDPVAWHSRQGFEIRVRGEDGTRVLLNEDEAIKLIESGRASPVRAVVMDVGQLRFRSRLWSVSDSQLAWLLRPGAGVSARAARKRLMAGASSEKMSFPGP